MDYYDEFDDNLGAMPTKAQKLLLGHTGPDGNNNRDYIHSYIASPTENDFNSRPSSSSVLKQAFRSTMGKSFRRTKRTESGLSALSLRSPTTPSRDSWGTSNMQTPSTANSIHAPAHGWPQTPTYKSKRSSNYSNITPRRISLSGEKVRDDTSSNQIQGLSPALITSIRDSMLSGKSTKSIPSKPKRKNTLQNTDLSLLEILTATGAKIPIPPPNRSRHASFSTPSIQNSEFTVQDDAPELPPIPTSYRNSKAPSQMNFLEPVDTSDQHHHGFHSPNSNPSEMDPFYLQKYAESPACFDFEMSTTNAESPLQSMTENTTVNDSPVVPSPCSKDQPLFKPFTKVQRKPWERPLCAPPPLELGNLSNISNEAMNMAMKQPRLSYETSKPAVVEEQVLPDSPILRDVESPETTLPYLRASPARPTTPEAQKPSLLAQRSRRNIFERFKKATGEENHPQPEVEETHPTDDIELLRHGDTHLDQFPGSPIDNDSIFDTISEAHSVLDSERLSSFFPLPPSRNSTGQISLHASSSTSDLSSILKSEEKQREKSYKQNTSSMEQLDNLIEDLESAITETAGKCGTISRKVSQVSLMSDDTASNVGHAIEHSRDNSLAILSKKFIQISGIDRPQLVVQGKQKLSSMAEGTKTAITNSDVMVFKVTLQSDSMDGQQTLNRSGTYDGSDKEIIVNNNAKVVQRTTKTNLHNMDLCTLLDIPSITETIATPMEEKDLTLGERLTGRQRCSTFSFWGSNLSNKRTSSSYHSRKASTNSITPSISSSSQSGDRRTSIQSAYSAKGGVSPTASSAKSSSEKWQNNRPESIDLENGYPTGSWFSYDSDLDERSLGSHQSTQEQSSKAPKILPFKSFLRTVKSYTAVQPAMV